MQKYLFWYAGIFAALIVGILACIAWIACMLFFQPAPQAAYYPGAQLVREVIFHAAV